MTFYPGGDPAGPEDGYPGSLFGIGHDWDDFISEIDIPVPVVSASKNVSELHTAQTLQPFADVRGGQDFPGAGVFRAALQYMPSQGSQATGKLYLAWGRHMQFERVVSHGWCELDLSDPQTRGWWYIEGKICHQVNDYMFDVPTAWADARLGGRCLITGRFRDGGLSGQGPTMYAIAPWMQGNPPAHGAELDAVTLLEYGQPFDGTRMDGYAESDEWSGAAWLTAGEAAAVVFIGTKGIGDTWYGYADGTVYEECLAQGNCPEDGDRGWWSTERRAQIIFFDTEDLAAVAEGRMAPDEPQPYATLDLEPFMYKERTINEYERLGGAAFDRDHGLLYVFERRADGDKCLVHVWGLENTPEGPVPAVDGNVYTRMPDYDGDGRADPGVFWGTVGNWYIAGSQAGGLFQNWGWNETLPVPGDYDGDGRADLAVYYPVSGTWYVHPSGGGYIEQVLGDATTWPVPADYDGDEQADMATYDLLTGDWLILASGSGTVLSQQWGAAQSFPVPADYDGDGRADLATYTPGNGMWNILNSGGGTQAVNWGWSAAAAVPADYDGDDQADMAVYWPQSGNWYLHCSQAGVRVQNWGWSAAVPVPGDYDGDGRDDIAVYYPAWGNWYMLNSSNSTVRMLNWGWMEARPAR